MTEKSEVFEVSTEISIIIDEPKNLEVFTLIDEQVDKVIARHQDVVIDCTTTQGMGEALKGRREFRELRVDLDKKTKEAGKAISAFKKRVDEKADIIIEKLRLHETKYDVKIKEEEKRKEDERLAKEKAREEALRIKMEEERKERERIEAEKKAEQDRKLAEEKAEVARQKKEIEDLKEKMRKDQEESDRKAKEEADKIKAEADRVKAEQDKKDAELKKEREEFEAEKARAKKEKDDYEIKIAREEKERNDALKSLPVTRQDEVIGHVESCHENKDGTFTATVAITNTGAIKDLNPPNNPISIGHEVSESMAQINKEIEEDDELADDIEEFVLKWSHRSDINSTLVELQTIMLGLRG